METQQHQQLGLNLKPMTKKLISMDDAEAIARKRFAEIRSADSRVKITVTKLSKEILNSYDVQGAKIIFRAGNKKNEESFRSQLGDRIRDLTGRQSKKKKLSQEKLIELFVQTSRSKPYLSKDAICDRIRREYAIESKHPGKYLKNTSSIVSVINRYLDKQIEREVHELIHREPDVVVAAPEPVNLKQKIQSLISLSGFSAEEKISFIKDVLEGK